MKANGLSNAERARAALEKPPVAEKIVPDTVSETSDGIIPIKQKLTKVEEIQKRIANGDAEPEIIGTIEKAEKQPKAVEPEVVKSETAKPEPVKPEKRRNWWPFGRNNNGSEVVEPVKPTSTSLPVKQPVPGFYDRDRTGEGPDPHEILKNAKGVRQEGGQDHVDTKMLNESLPPKKVEDEKKGYVETQIREEEVAEQKKAA